MERMRELRKKREMTQEDLARRLHVSQQSIAKWENGNTMPRADKLAACAKALRCSVDALLRTK
ncbi:MAG: helix-turn-helix transcriptional regulator [Christensenella sp.]|nr:helix-turn-helix transcriptional regulator [Christensenella sp.]